MAKGFQKGTLITTERGVIPIEKVKIGDMVLTHTNKYRKVLEIKKEDTEGCYRLQTQGSPNTFMGKDQQLICVERTMEYNKETKTSERVFSNRRTKKIEKMSKDDFICIGKNTKRNAIYTRDEIWFFAKFINKGTLDFNKKETTVYIKKNNKKYKKYVKDCKIIETKNYIKCISDNLNIYELCKYFQNNQTLPSYFMELPDGLLKEFLYSYIEDAGKKTEDNYYFLKHPNKMFVYQIGQIVSNINSFGGFSLFWEEGEKSKNYRIQFKNHIPKSANFVRIKNYLWQPVREIVEQLSFRGTLYSLKVDVDKSYVANGIVVKE